MLQNSFSDPAITGGVIGAVIILAETIKTLANKYKPTLSDGNGGKISEAEWRGKVTTILNRLAVVSEKQTDMLKEHYNACNAHHSKLLDKVDHLEPH